MKKLEISQMENLQGGVDQRNCTVLGGVIAGTAVAGLFVPGALLGTLAAIGAAAAADCF